MNRSKPLWIALLLMASMSGCVMESSKVLLGCPPIVEYTKEDQMQLSRELSVIPKDAMIWRFMQDYATERDMLRACRP